MKNFVFVTNTTYPTERAYGVTIGRTAEAAQLQGNKAEIWAAYFNGRDEFDVKVKALFGSKSIRFIDIFYKVNERLAFGLQKLISVIVVYVRIKRQNTETIYWTREVLTAIICSRKKSKNKVLLEIHHPLSRFQIKLLKNFSRASNIYLGYISYYVKVNTKLQIKESKSFILPMAASFEFFNENTKKRFNGTLEVCFIGKSRSSGHDNGILELLDSISVCKNKNIKANFTFIGLEKDFASILKNKLINLNLTDRVTIISHITHKKIPEKLTKFDIGIIPYPHSKYNMERFPIKLAEYCASGLVPIVSNSNNYEELISTDCAVFYDPTDVFSLSESLEKFIRNDKLLQTLSENARMWAAKFTYENRINIVLRAISTPSC